jgi:uncharacterized protein
VEDVKIGEYRRPWNAKPDARRLAAGIPKATLWAYDPNGIDQIGCIYTAQGFEFDYVGVIVGNDLTRNMDEQKWEAHTENSFDVPVKRAQGKLVELIKNSYRVLFSRGMKGCYVYFIDKDTERFFKSRMDIAKELEDSAWTSKVPISRGDTVIVPFRRLPIEDVKPFVNCVPLYDLKVAAGMFSDEQQVNDLLYIKDGQDFPDIDWIELPDAFIPRPGLFVTQVIGESMNRRIPNEAWCLFSLNPVGTRQGKVVLVRHREIADIDTGGHYTVKVYDSAKDVQADGTWRHASIILRPDTTASGYEPIILNEKQSHDLKVIAELVAVLG